MIIVLGMLSIVLILLVCGVIRYKIYDALDSFGPSIIVSIIFGILLIIILGASYSTYLDCRSFWDITQEQYRNSIVMYEDKAVLKVNKDSFTDLKYQGYQENIAKLITDLRGKVVVYNIDIIQKRIMKNNIVFSWLITQPDDNMKILTLIEKGG